MSLPEVEPLSDIQEEDAPPSPQPPSSYPPVTHSPIIGRDEKGHAGRRRSSSSVSRVNIDFFDRDGVARLERTLTTMSQQSQAGQQSIDSDTTINFDGPFDYAKTLRQISRR